MTKRSHTLVVTLVITATIMLFPSTARLQEQTTPAASPAQENSTYTITRGDTLWDIANSALKDPFLWPLIWKENPGITNPDLIYPGSKLTIPSLAPIERAMQAPVETAPIAATPVEHAEKSEAAAPAVPAPAAAAPAVTKNEIAAEPAAPAQEEAPAPAAVAVKKTTPKATAPVETPEKNELILEQETTRALIDKYTMLSAGYISSDRWTEFISGALEPRTMFGFNDIVFISVGSPENVKIGDRYVIFAPVKKVRHPETGRNLGSLIKVLGILQVTENAPGATNLAARISLAFDSIAKGSFLAPYQEPILIESVPKNDGRSIEGCIVEVMDNRTINGNLDMLYLDKGNNDGVKPGDHFVIFIDPIKKGFPHKIIGEAMVVQVKDTTSTAVVNTSRDAIAKGDRFELSK
jgi:LysM repeat protein